MTDAATTLDKKCWRVSSNVLNEKTNACKAQNINTGWLNACCEFGLNICAGSDLIARVRRRAIEQFSIRNTRSRLFN